MNTLTFFRICRLSLLVLLVPAYAISVSGCGGSGNTVVEPGDGSMTEQDMIDYEEQVQAEADKYKKGY
ncbi:peptidylprolyl isomerase [Allorhodopirellula solitaria]|uniref:Secreted protein n=1 Tax=Allorhodopirellula solitaria TaxID=2527987 RepID=A0A5C5X2E8_9BACT|nr:hypothetical protein [Allorhodopirellula solitaria]TWT56333.1 hypothetical protein CA85_43360 [Allorhodopirellula solitaria]